jgi:hypothetical protein
MNTGMPPELLGRGFGKDSAIGASESWTKPQAMMTFTLWRAASAPEEFDLVGLPFDQWGPEP